MAKIKFGLIEFSKIDYRNMENVERAFFVETINDKVLVPTEDALKKMTAKEVINWIRNHYKVLAEFYSIGKIYVDFQKYIDFHIFIVDNTVHTFYIRK